MKEKKKRRTLAEHFGFIWNLLGEERNILTKTMESFDGTYIKYDSDGDAYFKSLSQKNILRK